MKNKVAWSALLMLAGVCTHYGIDPVTDRSDDPDQQVGITIIYDNYQFDPALDSDWGFACLIQYQSYELLFDAGRKAGLYRKNMEKLDIHPGNIPSLVISHRHGDHTAGIPWVTEVNPDIRCYLPASYAEELKDAGKLPANSVAVLNATHLYGPFYSTGEQFEAFREQGLVVRTENGGVLITGCGHPGIVEMVKLAKEELGIEVKAVIGGLHLMRASEDHLREISGALKKMGVHQICPTHCTGDHSISVLKEAFGEGFLPGGTGQKMTIL